MLIQIATKQQSVANSIMLRTPYFITFLLRFIMSTRHIVRVNPLHSSILLTVIYTIAAFVVFLFGFLLTTVSSGFDLQKAFAGFSAEALWSAIAINLVLVFIGSFLLTLIYNFLAKYLGGIEITLDDD